MFGFLPAALLLCLAGQLDLDGYTTAELRAGEAPLLAGQAPRAGVISVVTPGLQLWYRSRTTELRLDSGVRIFWREPNDLGKDRPLFLSVTSLSATNWFSRRFRGTASASASVGEPDYTDLSRILGPSQSTLPQSVDKILSITAGVRGDYQATRTLALSTAITATDLRPIGDAAAVAPVDPATGFPRQKSVLVVPSLLQQLSRQGGLTFTAPVSYGTYSTGFDVFTATPLLGWAAHLTRDVDLRVAAGIAYVNILSVPAVSAVPGTPAPVPTSDVSPAGDVQVAVRLLTEGQVLVRSTTQARVDYYVDPVLGVTVPRGLIVSGVSVTLAPRWILGANASFATSLAAHPLPATPGTLPVDETIVAVSVPIQRRISEHVLLEFGGRYADAGPHLSRSGLGFHQRQLWAYVTLTLTSRRIPQWTVP